VPRGWSLGGAVSSPADYTIRGSVVWGGGAVSSTSWVGGGAPAANEFAEFYRATLHL